MGEITKNEATAAIHRVLDSVRELRTVRVTHANCRAINQFPDNQDVEIVSTVQVSFDCEPGYIGTRVRYDVTAAPPDTTDKASRIWSIHLVLCADWMLAEGHEVPPSDATYFAIGQGVMTCHPYARETVQSLSMRMGYPPATIDIIRNPWAEDELEINEPQPAPELPKITSE